MKLPATPVVLCAAVLITPTLSAQDEPGGFPKLGDLKKLLDAAAAQAAPAAEPLPQDEEAFPDLPTLPVAADVDEEPKAVLRFRDGTVIVGKPITREFPIETPYGTLTIPLSELRSATFGVRASAEEKAKADEAIKQLGSDNFKERSVAQARLLQMGERAAQAIGEALGGDLDPETRGSLKKLAKEVAPEGFDRLLRDTIRAKSMRASGKLAFDAVEVDSSLGRFAISIDKLEEIRSISERVFTEGFESFRGKADGWELYSNGDTTWHASANNAISGKRCLWCGVRGGTNYSDNAQAIITSPVIDTSGLDQPALTFNHLLGFEDGSDFCRLELSMNGGRSWVTGATFVSNGAWSKRMVDLSRYRSENFRFRFVFQADSSNTDVGMHVDDISIDESDAL